MIDFLNLSGEARALMTIMKCRNTVVTQEAGSLEAKIDGKYPCASEFLQELLNVNWIRVKSEVDGLITYEVIPGASS